MKVLTFLSIFLSPLLFNYKDYTLESHPMYSRIWNKKYEITLLPNGVYDTTSVIVPKYGGKFKIITQQQTDSIKNLIDFNFVELNLINYLNKFRLDYKINPVNENLNLMVSSKEYAEVLLQINKLVHSTNSSKRFEEAIVFVPFGLFSKVSKNDGDMSELVLESCFDIFVGSPGHMSVLLHEDTLRSFGVGISVAKTGYYVVVQSIVE
jgi:hypothetical protein